MRAHVYIHAATILKRSDVGARAPTSALVFRQLRVAGKQIRCVRRAQRNIVWLWLDGTTAVTIHIHHGAQATCADRQPPESESMSMRTKVCCRMTSHVAKTLSCAQANAATGTEPYSNEIGAPGEIRVLAPGWSPTASLATRAVYMRHAATLSSQRKSGHKSSDRERGQHAIRRRVKNQFTISG